MDGIKGVYLPTEHVPETTQFHWSDVFTAFRHENCAPQDKLSDDSLVFYPVTNELWPSYTLGTIAKTNPSVCGNTLFCIGGISSFLLFVLNEQMEIFINIDPNPDQALLLNLFVSAVKEAIDGDDVVDIFLRNFMGCLFNKTKIDKEMCATLLAAFLRGTLSPFAIDGGFEKIKRAALLGNIQSFCINLANVELVEDFARVARSIGIQAHSVNGSNLNVYHWQDVVPLETFQRSMDALARTSSGNVHFLTCEVEEESPCCCSRKVLTVITDCRYYLSPQVDCKSHNTHTRRCLMKLSKYFLEAFMTRFVLNYPFPTFLKRILPIKKSPTILDVKEAIRLFSPKHIWTCDALLTQTLDDLWNGDLGIEAFTSRVRDRFPIQSEEYRRATPAMQMVTFEASFIIESVFFMLIRSLSQE